MYVEDAPPPFFSYILARNHVEKESNFVFISNMVHSKYAQELGYV